jgi:hypothetical protein
MAGNQLIAAAQAKLDECRRQLRVAASDFSIADETVLELRNAARRAYDELKFVEEKSQRKGILSFLGL